MGFWNANRKRLAVMVVAIGAIAGLARIPLASPQALWAGEQPAANVLSADLVTAIRNGDDSAIRKLLDGGADVNARDVAGNTPLILAAFYAGPECVELLLKRGAEVNAANKAGVTAMIRAATNFEKTRLLVAAGAHVRVRTAGLGNTPLILACRPAGNSRTVKLLLDRGADAREANNFGATPIMAAAASGDVEIAKLLLDRGADPNVFPNVMQPPELLASGSRTALMWAAYRNDVPMIRLLLDRGADVNKVNAVGTALAHAAWHDNLKAATLLLERGARVDIPDPFAGFTPLHWAAASESPRADLVKLLLARGADPNAVGGEQVGAFGLVPQTPRLLAEKRGRTAIVSALIAAGAKEPPPVRKIVTPSRNLPEKLDNAMLIAAAEKALAVLQTTAAKSRDFYLRHVSHQNCVSCHQQYLPMAAVGHARGRSVRFDPNLARQQIDLVTGLNDQFFSHEFIAQTVFHPDPAYSYGYEMFALHAEKVPACRATDVHVHHLVTVQSADGRWVSNFPRPPIQSSDVGATALALQAIQRYGWPGRRAEFKASVERARRWLWKVRPETTEEAVFQLLGLHWAGEPAEKLAGLAEALLKMQRKDGGWAQLSTLDSDVYATGEVLFTLVQTVQYPVSDPAWQRGLRFMLERQEDDGTWHVARRTFPFQPTMPSGFPHHRDSWLSAAATSWAVLALTQALPAGTPSGTPAVAQKTSSPPVAKVARQVDFAQHIKPLLERSCIACHSGEMARAHFRVDSRDAILKGGESGAAAVVAGRSDKSPIIDYVSGRMPESEMPPRSKRNRFPALNREELALLRAWIDQGAPWPGDVRLTPPAIEKKR
jgi:ankyrin repeat protein